MKPEPLKNARLQVDLQAEQMGELLISAVYSSSTGEYFNIERVRSAVEWLRCRLYGEDAITDGYAKIDEWLDKAFEDVIKK